MSDHSSVGRHNKVPDAGRQYDDRGDGRSNDLNLIAEGHLEETGPERERKTLWTGQETINGMTNPAIAPANKNDEKKQESGNNTRPQNSHDLSPHLIGIFDRWHQLATCFSAMAEVAPE